MIPLLQRAAGLPLTETEREILGWVQEHPMECLSMDLQTLAGRLYTSSATIIRFCQKLGMRGFNEFKYQLRSEMRAMRQPVFLSQDLRERSLALFRDNIEAVDLAALEQAAGFLTSGRPVYLFGTNLSSLPAGYLHSVMTTLDYHCIFLTWPALLRGLALQVDEGSVVLIVTAHGDAERYLSVFEDLQKRSATRILITCEPESPLIPYSSIVLCSNDLNHVYHHVDTNPRIGMLTIVQLLIELILQKHDQSTAPAPEEPAGPNSESSPGPGPVSPE